MTAVRMTTGGMTTGGMTTHTYHQPTWLAVAPPANATAPLVTLIKAWQLEPVEALLGVCGRAGRVGGHGSLEKLLRHSLVSAAGQGGWGGMAV